MFRPITFQSYKDIAYNCANKIITQQRIKTHLQIDLEREAILNHFIMWTTSTLHLHHQRETEISTHKIQIWYRKTHERLGKINWRLSMLWSSAYFHRHPHCKFSIIISIKIEPAWKFWCLISILPYCVHEMACRKVDHWWKQLEKVSMILSQLFHPTLYEAGAKNHLYRASWNLSCDWITIHTQKV
jgi:hypothetical protein